jgi:hypothetical protein
MTAGIIFESIIYISSDVLRSRKMYCQNFDSAGEGTHVELILHHEFSVFWLTEK